MRWLLKAAAQRALSPFPHAERMNYAFQRHVTHSLPIRKKKVRGKFNAALGHVAAYLEHGPDRPLEEAVFYEFGAGWDLTVPIAYWMLGVESQIVVDLRPNLRLELLNASARKLSRLAPRLEVKAGWKLRKPTGAPLTAQAQLEPRFGIRYLAPRDARATGLEPESVDFVSNTATLEHVPAPDLVPILAECRRLLRGDGAISCRIDLRDHYSYVDRNLSPYNFLRFGERTWRLLNPALHHQNRLRRPDYLRAFTAAGFEIVAEEIIRPSRRDLAALDRIRLAPTFADYPRDEIAVKGIRIVVKPSG
jgi:SAM-dependent methyltransferase